MMLAFFKGLKLLIPQSATGGVLSHLLLQEEQPVLRVNLGSNPKLTKFRKAAGPTCPPPLTLLVSLTLLKVTAAFIQCAPKFGESGWM